MPLQGTSISASTVHALFDFDLELSSKLDFSRKPDDAQKKVRELMECEIVFIDEFSMLDVDICTAIHQALQKASYAKANGQHSEDEVDKLFGTYSIIFFGDFKQLPPATSKGPFIIIQGLIEQFDFRVLRQNRRVNVGDAARQGGATLGAAEQVDYGRAAGTLERFRSHV